MACGELDGGSSYNCDTPLQGGAEPNVLLINYKHVLGKTDGAITNLIESLILENGKSGFLYEGFGRSVTPQQEVIKLGNSQNLAKHQVGIIIFDRSQQAKNNIQNLMLGKFVAIVQGSSKDEQAFEIYGLNNGLELVPGVIQQLNENNGAYLVTLATGENQAESKLPQTLFDTDFATTYAYVRGLAYIPSILNLSVLAVLVAGGTAMVVTGKNYFGGGAASAVTSVVWVNQSTLAETTQTGVTVSSDTTMNFSSVALAAGTYKLKITTTKGVVSSNVNVVAA
jgi:hypothetical protein